MSFRLLYVRELLPIFVMQGKIMKFVKKKPKIIAYYAAVYLLIAAAVAFLFRTSLYMQMIAELIVAVPFLIFIRLVICEINQTVTVGENSIECKNFIINGHPADAVISYDIVSKIEIKRVPLKPFSKCLCLSLDGDKPVIINDDYGDYSNLWKMICDNCRAVDPNLLIDRRTEE